MSSWDCKVKVADNLRESSNALNEISVNVLQDICSKYQDLLVRTFQQVKECEFNDEVDYNVIGRGHICYLDGERIIVNTVTLGADDTIYVEYHYEKVTKEHKANDTYRKSFMELMEGGKLPYYKDSGYCIEQAKGLVEAVLKYFRFKIHEGKFRVFGTIQTRTLDFDFPLAPKYNTKDESWIKIFIATNADKIIEMNKEKLLSQLLNLLQCDSYKFYVKEDNICQI